MARRSVYVLDNRDSFVWNLALALQSLGARVAVVRSDRTTIAEIEAGRPDALVLSPGPGHPSGAGICVPAVRALAPHIPVLGVCLGHQAIAAAFGGTIARGTPCHGKTSPIDHGGDDLFRGLPQPLHACRYHSLVVEPDLPVQLQAQAHTRDGVLMALRHRRWPTFGVQFHPESFRSEHGAELLRNFLECAA